MIPVPPARAWLRGATPGARAAFAALIAPLATSEFLDSYWLRRPLVLPAADGARLAELPSSDDLWRLLRTARRRGARPLWFATASPRRARCGPATRRSVSWSSATAPRSSCTSSSDRFPRLSVCRAPWASSFACAAPATST